MLPTTFIGGGGRIAECIAMEMAKLNVTIVLWDINEGTVTLFCWSVTCMITALGLR